MATMEQLIAQYTGANEDSRLTRQYIAQLEYDTTMHKLRPYIQNAEHVCELGAATGRYSLAFAKMGCHVTAVELAPDQVNILKQKATQQSLELTIHEGNACSVPYISDESQQVCVILGPLYHLKTLAERQQALSEAYRMLKPNGLLAVAYISSFFVAGMFAQQCPELITPDVLLQLRQSGTVSDPRADDFFKVGYFATPSEIEHLISEAGFSVNEHIATDGFGRYIAKGVNHFSPEQYRAWRDHHFATCDEPTLLGSSNHGLVIARKVS
jgi:ubiquinone/menaquinone biosynthesis C-methylase UbiE